MDWRELHVRFGSPPATNARWVPEAFECDADLPASYVAFMDQFGPGTLGGFLHFQPPAYLNTFRDRMAPFIDGDLEAALETSGEILIFADSDNGDSCGWSVSNAGGPVLHLPPRSFDARVLADDVADLFAKIVTGADLFGVGPLELTYRPADPFGRLRSAKR